LLTAVIEKLGFRERPLADLEGLRAVYGAWCREVPFDNARKLMALRSGRTLPGREASDFFEAWLEHGTGATCWPSSHALATLLEWLGFDVVRVTGSMGDSGVPNHGSAKAALDGREWLVDSSILTLEPLPLGEDAIRTAGLELERDGDTHLLRILTPPQTTPMPCRIRHEAVWHSFYLERYEESRLRSVFNEKLYAKRHRPGGELVVVTGNTRHLRTAEGVESRELAANELEKCLREEIGYSEKIYAELSLLL
jgi:arylamine N-acetyltransferase